MGEIFSKRTRLRRVALLPEIAGEQISPKFEHVSMNSPDRLQKRWLLRLVVKPTSIINGVAILSDPANDDAGNIDHINSLN